MKIKKLTLTALLALAPLTHTPQTQAKPEETAMVVFGGVVAIIGGVAAWCGITKSYENSQLQQDKESVTNVETAQPSQHLQNITDIVQSNYSWEQKRQLIADYLNSHDIKIEEISQTYVDMRQKRKVLSTNIEHWKHKYDREELRKKAINTLNKTESLYQLLNASHLFFENETNYLSLYKLYHSIKSHNYRAPHDYPYIRAAETMHSDYTRLKRALPALKNDIMMIEKKLYHNPHNKDLQEQHENYTALYTESQNLLSELHVKHRNLIDSDQYNKERHLQKTVQQKLEEVKALKKIACEKERTNTIYEQEVREKRKKNNNEEERLRQERERRRAEGVFGPERRDLNNQIHSLSITNRHLTNKANNLSEDNNALRNEIEYLKKIIKETESRQNSEQNKEEIKKLKDKIAYLQRLANNPPVNPETIEYGKILKDEINKK